MAADNTIYDDVLRTIQERHPKLLIPLINEVFHTDYAENEEVTRLPEEYQKVVSKVIADGCNMICNHVYHIECQSTKDGRLIIRMVEYDFMIGLSRVEWMEGRYRLHFPKSCIIYLRHDSDTRDEEQMEIELADGQIITYKVPVMKMQQYTKNEIFAKRLFICLPFYIMRYEKELHEIGQDDVKTGELLAEYAQILDWLKAETGENEAGIYQDLFRLMKRIADYQLRKERILKERMDSVMGGKVLELPSDKLRQERAEGILQGEQRVNKLIITLTRQGRTADIIRAAEDHEFQKKLFEEFGI
jgi:hypothetical protein